MKINSFNSILRAIPAIVLSLLLYACSDMNDLHREYMERGETIYIGKVDSAEIYGGRNRAKLKYWSSDPRATKLRVYWMSRKDSAEFSIPPGGGKDAVEADIPNITENSHSFELVTFTSDLKYRSIADVENANIYGARYQSSLRDRSILSALYSEAKKEWTITWLGAVENGISSDITYTDSTGVVITRSVPMSETQTIIKYPAKDLKYRTRFLPDAKAIDIFYTEFRPLVN
jgi:hypothetical protein